MITDDKLRDLIEEALDWEPGVSSTDVGVSCDGGVATLSGHVASWSEKWSAERAAMHVKGVKGLANEIDVKLAHPYQRSDTDLARAAVDALRWRTTVPEDSIQVTVKDGCVRLRGDVERYFQRSEAEAAVRHLHGVRRVGNDIAVKPSGSSVEDVKLAIVQALERSARLDADGIRIDANGRDVVLRGTVSSLSEKEEAEQAAWNAPGVWRVDNRLTVGR